MLPVLSLGMSRIQSSLLALAVLAACGTPAVESADFEAVSLLGDTLYRPALDSATEALHRARLDTARINWEADTGSADNLIWLGRRTAYLGRYREAIAIFTSGVERFPDDPRFLRHRGHRWITVRDFDQALADLTGAAHLIAGKPDEIEPDGLPNARNVPTSTLHSNIWYHLGLAHYLKGDFERALRAYEQEAATANNQDMLVATSWWRYLTLRRLGRTADADTLLVPIAADLDVIENGSYHRLLLLAKGELEVEDLLPRGGGGSDGTPADAAVQYGVGAWHLVEGRTAVADSLFRDLIARGNWAAFGVIAAEAEVARGMKGE